MRRTAMCLGLIFLLVLPSVAQGHVLSYGRAKAAAQKRADLWAGRRAEVHMFRRVSRHAFYARARWRDPGVPAEDASRLTCTMAMRVGVATPRSLRVIIRTRGPRCG